MEIRKLDRERLGPDNNHSQRLMPWSAVNAPFEGAWCVIKPGASSVKHAHHEYEIFIAMSGEAVLESADERITFVAGDIVHFPPFVDHQVINESGTDFEMYTVWWDTEMSEKFVARHRAEG
ncbi:MAG TPA: cupin domain-containing protein [Actinophytocola sp.]|uniref:cupin domain-containing protein n=1 Tax=Actinophytocola sp. TaxID=1872138 RepID=UPI002DDD5A6A|nr:cupin domain-containing protein [Actinophytocola sp.]HEV2781552.1 cupin domain-containing protein [Actinophytocola sp.]